MKTGMKVLLAIFVIIIIGVVAVAFMGGNSTPATNLDPITSSEDLTALIEKVYEGLEIEVPMLMSQEIDVTDSDMVAYVTGLENADDVEYAVVSEPMMSSQAYSLVLVKVKDGVDASKVAKEMNENIDNRKWICVTAEKVYSTSSGNVVCLVMSNEETAKAVYENFKTLAGTVGEEYERTAEEIELPEDMLPTDEIEIPADDAEATDDLETPEDDTLSADDQLPAADPVE